MRLFLLLAFCFLVTPLASRVHAADPAPKADPANPRVNILKGAISLELPPSWSVFEDSRVGPLANNTIKVSFLAMLEDNPQVAISETYLRNYLTEHHAKSIEKLTEGRLLGTLEVEPDSTEKRWIVVKAIAPRYFVAANFSYYVTTPNPTMEKMVSDVVTSTVFTSLAKPVSTPAKNPPVAPGKPPKVKK